MTRCADQSWSGAPALTSRWVRLYTSGLPREVGEERRLEVASDVFEHIAFGESVGRGRAARVAVVGRTARGVVDDLGWRTEQRRIMTQTASSSARPIGLRAAWAVATQAWFAPAAALVFLFNIVLAVGILADEESTMPGRVVGPMVLFAFAAAMAFGLRMRWASRDTAGSRSASAGTRTVGYTRAAYALAIVAVVTMVGGAVGDTSILVVGVIATLALGASVVALRRSGRDNSAGSASTGPAVSDASQSGVLADALIIIGTLPAFAFFWIVVPAVLALVVVAGVVGSGPATRRRSAA